MQQDSEHDSQDAIGGDDHAPHSATQHPLSRTAGERISATLVETEAEYWNTGLTDEFW